MHTIYDKSDSDITSLIDSGQIEQAVAHIEAWPAVKLAHLLERLPLHTTKSLIGLLPPKAGALALINLPQGLRTLALQSTSQEHIYRMVKALDDKDTVTLLTNYPLAPTLDILKRIPHREQLEQCLTYQQCSAGAIMNNHFVAILNKWDIHTALGKIKLAAKTIGNTSEVYVVDEQLKLVGWLHLLDLLSHEPSTPVHQIMQAVVAVATPNMDQEEVLNLAEQCDVLSIPVVDEQEHIIGHITQKELRVISHHEHQEDLQLMHGVSPTITPKGSIKEIVNSRLPWLVGGLGGAACAAVVVVAFEEQLAQAAILASFIPIVMAMAGNAGIQASTITVQGLASGRIWSGNWLLQLAKELAGALINGGITALLLCLLVLLFSLFTPIKHLAQLTLTAGVSLTLITLLAVAVGVLSPILLTKLKLDPAVGSGVFITTANDIGGVLIFFLIAAWLYIP